MGDKIHSSGTVKSSLRCRAELRTGDSTVPSHRLLLKLLYADELG